MVAGKLSIYACGITVYDDCHLGHGRSMVCFDVMVRFLRSEGYEVLFVRNITDIDDKIITRAIEKGVDIDTLTQRYITSMHIDAHALGTLPPDIEPRATRHIHEIIGLIEKLIQSGYAYLTEEGDVCYSVANYSKYGQLSKQDVHALISGARVDVSTDKKSPLDFVLWKRAKPNEPFWTSPWGNGRPGWHIECSAMAMHHLGETFDIHGGGLDLQFPHHENEIAQSEAATGKIFARYWLHVGMLQVNDEKMSKSLGNFCTIQDVLKQYHPEVVRYFLLSSHYRSTLNYTEDNLINCSKALMRLYQTLKGIETTEAWENDSGCDWVQAFRQAMLDDFNTPIALSVLFQLSHEVNKTRSKTLAATLKHLGGILGLLQQPPELFLQTVVTANDEDEMAAVHDLIKQREHARASKDWALSDKIRAELQSKGIELEDSSAGTTWRWIL